MEVSTGGVSFGLIAGVTVGTILAVIIILAVSGISVAKHRRRRNQTTHSRVWWQKVCVAS